MTIKALKKIWFLSLLLVFFSCSDDDNEELFNEAPSTRIDQRISELQNLLLASPDGYRAIYFTKNDEYGGFTFYMKFNSDGTVEMTSDVDSETAITTSRYEVKMGTTTELLFSTRNHIHKVSDSNIPGLIGSGYEGNSNFQYISSENGNITFIEPRNEAVIIFEPVTAGDWANVDTSLARRSSLLPTATSSVFQGLTIEDASGNKTVYTLDYDSLRLFINSANQAEDGTVTEISYGIAYTTDGLVASPPIEIDGTSYETFVFNETSMSYISTVGGNTATIGFLEEPPFITNDVFDIGVDFTTFLYRPSLGTNPLTSLGFDAIIDQVNTELAGFGLVFAEFQLVTNPADDGNDTLLIIVFDRPSDGARFNGIYDLQGSIVDKKLVLDYQGPNPTLGNPGNSGFFETRVTALIDFFRNPAGMYYTTTGNFQTFINTAGTFVNAGNPSQRVYGLWFTL
ncbi:MULTISPECIES: DUF4302 domain-containing protein [Aquimarina]|uniref:DUF4302 domain-containing protein n=1 Tax=Aquimarina TaxID=290174 RepID=UPI000D68E673|nr:MULTISPECIES: DUF4302 domain-containing protein [Aquimarina]